MSSIHDEKKSHEYLEENPDEYDQQAALAHQYEPNTAAERSLVKKIDKRIVVCSSHSRLRS